MMEVVIGMVAVIGVFGYFALASIWRGYALSILWGWFIVPTFGLPPLGIPQAMAVSLIAGFLTYQYRPDGEKKDWWKPLLHVALVPAMALAVGWLVKQFI